MDKKRDERVSEFAPPDIYYAEHGSQQPKNPRKTHGNRPRVNVPAMQHHNVDNSIDDMVTAGISSIRAEMEQRKDCVNVADIPVPPESQNMIPLHSGPIVEKSLSEKRHASIDSTVAHQFQGREAGNTTQPMMPMYNDTQAQAGHTTQPMMPMYNDTPAQAGHTTHPMMPMHNDTPSMMPMHNDSPAVMPMYNAAPAPVHKDTPQNIASVSASPVEQQSHKTGTIASGPVLYERAGSQVSMPYKPRYERVNLHEVPLTLPAPPSVQCVPQYPSQEEVHKVQSDKDATLNERRWMGQYKFDSNNKSSETKIKTTAIPFPSPYVQSISDTNKLFPTDNFDPQKPPPKP